MRLLLLLLLLLLLSQIKKFTLSTERKQRPKTLRPRKIENEDLQTFLSLVSI